MNAPPGRKLSDLLCLDDIEALARSMMPASVYAYVSGGAADELTLSWNRERYREILLRARALIDVSRLDCTITLFGQRLAMPILVAPVSNQRLAHPEGELATARGAGGAGVAMVLSNGANTSIEDVARVATHPLWFQLYVRKDRGLSRALIDRAEAAGIKALCVTVDAPVDGVRNHQDRMKIIIPPGVEYPNYTAYKPNTTATPDEVSPALLEWNDIEWIRSYTKMPLLLKGIMNPLDAETAIKVGVDGLVVSNHGARCLDTQPATIEVLPSVTAQVNGRIPVLVDGGIRRGTDVVKALALGASAVQLGRPIIYGLAVGGAEGVARVLKLMRTELLLAMALLGRPTIASIDRSALWERGQLSPGRATRDPAPSIRTRTKPRSSKSRLKRRR